MAKTVILVRHGKAQTEAAGESDAQRPLAGSGRRAVAAWFPRVVPLLDVRKGISVQVWASPAVRTRQTAAEVVCAFEAHGVAVDGDVRVFECLWTQDVDEFLRLAREASADMVVAVGHVPFVEDACARLCGDQLSFDTGALAAIRLGGQPFDGSIDVAAPAEAVPTDSPAHLLWFMQGPAWQRWGTLCDAEDVLDTAAKRIDDRLVAFQADPDDVEAAHRLRVSIRTLRSLLAFAAPFQKKRWSGRVRDDLRDIVLQTSYLRELDVLSEQAAALQPPADDLLRACARMREAEQVRVCKVFAGKNVRKKMARTLKAMRSVHWKKRVAARGLSTEDIRTRFYQMARSSSMQLDQLDVSDAQAAHAVRKDVKQTRYVAEGFARILGPQAARIAESMTQVQDDLGSLCDARVNVDIVQRFPEAGLSEQALLDLALLEASNKAFVCTVLRAAGSFGGTEPLGAAGEEG
jgi:CHAD domain-containing protein/phosphohistidine phosphatase SixA